MYLKSIELQGFKSFADKTTLDFGAGITAVVGPNGSGKSNISDALRWVMGEISAKSLRGSAMQDVIFAGTQTRSPLNYAQVSLILENDDEKGIEFKQVKVTRKLYRSGDSEYLINNASCRLKDVHELFMDTGLGRDGYSMIGQGQISEILSTKANERRHIFEEAAGISKYRYKKEESERKLVSVDDNLVRITDITGELELQIEPLEKQAQKAKEFLKLYGDLKIYDVNIALDTIEKSKLALKQVTENYNEVGEEFERAKKSETDAQAKQAELYALQKKKDIELDELRNQLSVAEDNSKQSSGIISVHNNSIEKNTHLAGRIDNEILTIENKIKNQNKQIEQLAEEKQKILISKNELEESFSQQKELDTQLGADITAINARLYDVQVKLAEMANKSASDEAKLNGIEALRKNLIERKNVVEAELNAYVNGLEYTKNQLNDIEKELGIKNKALLQLTKQTEELDKKLTDITKEVSQINLNINDKSVQRNSKNSKKSMLEDMERYYDGYAKSVKSVLTSPELSNQKIYGTVASLIEVDTKYVTAIEVVLGGSLQNIITQTEDEAKTAISYLKRNNLGRATFLPISSVNGRILENLDEIKDEKGFLGVATQFVSCDNKFDGIVKNLLGRVVVVDNVDNAVLLSKKHGYKFRVVTLEGEILSPGGSLSGGSVNKGSSFLSRSNEIKQLALEIDMLDDELIKLKNSLEAKNSQISLNNTQLKTATELVSDYKNTVTELSMKKQALNEGLLSSDSAKETLEIEQRKIDVQLKELENDVVCTINAVSTVKFEAENLKGELETLQIELCAKNEAKDVLSKEITKLIVETAKFDNNIKVADEKNREINSQIQAFHIDIENKKDEKQQIFAENDLLAKEIEEKQNEIKELLAKVERVREEITEHTRQKEAIIDKISKNQSENNELRDEIFRLQEQVTKLEGNKNRLEMEEENIINRLWEDYELTYSTALAIKADIGDILEAKKYVAKLRADIKRLGNVNLSAVEEFEVVKERYDFLTTQKNDLEHARDNLLKVIRQMQGLMESQFKEQFDRINESFSRVFIELFGGGRARLFLTDESDVLQSGIEIEVQLPGKGLQNINLYSGGEKTFIAIALLLAIINVRPTPFCLLDEIDAALDDVNVSRYATYVKNNYSQTQFVIITHRRGTMEIANMLYGVTMQEKGVSKLLALDIDEIQPFDN